MRRRRAIIPPDASKSPLVAPGEARRRKAADSALQREIDAVVPSDAEIDRATYVSETDIRHAINAWDNAQREESTGLEGLLDARLADDE